MKLSKLLTAVIFLCAVNAHADNELGYISNQAGGSIIFTFSQCVYVSTGEVIPKHFYVYGTDKYGNKGTEGCYEYKSPFYVVKWNGGGRLTVNTNQVRFLK